MDINNTMNKPISIAIIAIKNSDGDKSDLWLTYLDTYMKFSNEIVRLKITPHTRKKKRLPESI